MTNRKDEMKAVFAGLSEKNKDIMLMIARGMKTAQEDGRQVYPQAKPTLM